MCNLITRNAPLLIELKRLSLKQVYQDCYTSALEEEHIAVFKCVRSFKQITRAEGQAGELGSRRAR